MQAAAAEAQKRVHPDHAQLLMAAGLEALYPQLREPQALQTKAEAGEVLQVQRGELAAAALLF